MAKKRPSTSLPTATERHFFFPPGRRPEKLQDADTPIVLVEAEKSSSGPDRMGRSEQESKLLGRCHGGLLGLAWQDR